MDVLKDIITFRHLSDRNTDNFWYLPGSPLNFDTDRCIKTIINTCKINPPICPRRALSTLRLLKSPAEARLMLETCKVGSAAINNAMACTKPGKSYLLYINVINSFYHCFICISL